MRYAFVIILLVGCGDPVGLGDAGLDAGRVDAGVDAGRADAGSIDDAAVPSADAAEGAPCSFNGECAADHRCECDEATGCFCRAGARGMGQVGIDTCADGNDCASAVCVEGPDAAYYCSGECADDADCAGALPMCADIAFVGRICIRQPTG